MEKNTVLLELERYHELKNDSDGLKNIKGSSFFVRQINYSNMFDGEITYYTVERDQIISELDEDLKNNKETVERQSAALRELHNKIAGMGLQDRFDLDEEKPSFKKLWFGLYIKK